MYSGREISIAYLTTCSCPLLSTVLPVSSPLNKHTTKFHFHYVPTLLKCILVKCILGWSVSESCMCVHTVKCFLGVILPLLSMSYLPCSLSIPYSMLSKLCFLSLGVSFTPILVYPKLCAYGGVVLHHSTFIHVYTCTCTYTDSQRASAKP